MVYFKRKGSSSIDQLNQSEFEREFTLAYLPSLGFENAKTEERIKKQCKKAIKNRYVDEERLWLGALYSDKLATGAVGNIYIEYIDSHIGYGVFAKEEIPAWKYIGEYTGIVKKHPLFKSIINPYCFSYPTSSFSWSKHSIDALQAGNETRFINHSLQPNCESIAVFHEGLLHIVIRSIKIIPKEEQLLYDYGNEL